MELIKIWCRNLYKCECKCY